MIIDEALLDIRVASTRIDELRFEMDPPLALAGRKIATREYLVMQVTLENGIVGTGYVLTRGQPIGAAAESVTQYVLGRNLTSLFAREERARGTSAEQRAQAVLDNCAWDLAGQLRQVPTWELLGRTSSSQPALLVAGYRRDGESDQVMARRLVQWRDKGFRSIKIAASFHDDSTTRLLRAIRDLVPADELAVVLDLGFAGRDVSEIADAIGSWQPYGVTWVEDPLPSCAAADMAALRASAPLPIAAGDEASPGELHQLLNQSAVDVLRADSTTVGGLSGVSDLAARANVPVSLHVYPETHRHAAMVMQTESPVEMFPPNDDFDFVDRFLHYAEPAVVDGRFLAPTAPGLGVVYRPEAVTRNVVRSASFMAD
ncbi:enolase C-terminal domain-like protein [Mycolicibacterium helvum]|uniref:Dehydratase n=1 Tax=Mycolicibacterium helvum TaxID=1534349 RepID=A0A7I7TAM0_9MYCO|nr:enolase C-terminal domain-like protein [Mycolicibacterium helvum]BBY65521.1 dehydratase [Mycolicibacterium helvum]